MINFFFNFLNNFILFFFKIIYSGKLLINFLKIFFIKYFFFHNGSILSYTNELILPKKKLIENTICVKINMYLVKIYFKYKIIN